MQGKWECKWETGDEEGREGRTVRKGEWGCAPPETKFWLRH